MVLSPWHPTPSDGGNPIAQPAATSMKLELRSQRGVSLVDLLITVAVIATAAAMAVPVMSDLTSDIKVSEAARMVERELQDARLKAVSSNRVLRVRMNCPNRGYIRTVEFLNSSADTSGNRCNPQTYPYPAADDDVLTRPNYDGPMRALPSEAQVGNHIIQFHPDGTARNVVNNVAQTITSPVNITVSRSSKSRTITVNGAGKIQLQ
jgi:Tfp pilus assembly protein FimT